MARLAAVEQGEYYPTPLSIVDSIAQVIDIKEGRGVIRLFDPCAGKGLALAQLAGRIRQKAPTLRHLETWGIEISPDRANEAAKRLDAVVEAPFEAVGWQPGNIKKPISLAFVNPPYDRRKLPRFFRVYIADECHKAKAKSTDAGWAFQILP